MCATILRYMALESYKYLSSHINFYVWHTMFLCSDIAFFGNIIFNVGREVSEGVSTDFWHGGLARLLVIFGV